MRMITIAAAALLAVGCSQEQQTMTNRPNDNVNLDAAEPAASNIHPAEATGYIDATDPEAFPPTPGQSSGQLPQP